MRNVRYAGQGAIVIALSEMLANFPLEAAMTVESSELFPLLTHPLCNEFRARCSRVGPCSTHLCNAKA